MDEQTKQQSEEFYESDTCECSAPRRLFILWVVIMASVAAGIAAGYKTHDVIAKSATEEHIRLETAKQMKAGSDFNLETAKIDRDLRLKIAHDCVDRGDVPVLMNGNVDCKKP